jgi:hypothetical protein
MNEDLLVSSVRISSDDVDRFSSHDVAGSFVRFSKKDREGKEAVVGTSEYRSLFCLLTQN